MPCRVCSTSRSREGYRGRSDVSLGHWTWPTRNLLQGGNKCRHVCTPSALRPQRPCHTKPRVNDIAEIVVPADAGTARTTALPCVLQREGITVVGAMSVQGGTSPGSVQEHVDGLRWLALGYRVQDGLGVYDGNLAQAALLPLSHATIPAELGNGWVPGHVGQWCGSGRQHHVCWVPTYVCLAVTPLCPGDEAWRMPCGMDWS